MTGLSFPAMARPSKYSDEIAAEICQRIAEGECLPAVCRDPKMPSKRAVMKWLTLPEHQTFRAMYAAAREMQADALFDLMRDIADDGRNDYMERQPGCRSGKLRRGAKRSAAPRREAEHAR